MSEHTPEPWTIADFGGIVGSGEIHTNGRARGGLGFSSASYSEHVATVHGDMSLPGPRANASLLVAAPALLKACEDLCISLEEACARNGYTVPASYGRAKDAIAKAKGAS